MPRREAELLERLLLDTTFLIDADRSHTNLDDLIGDEDDVAIAAITVAELQIGVEFSKGKTKHSRTQLWSRCRLSTTTSK